MNLSIGASCSNKSCGKLVKISFSHRYGSQLYKFFYHCCTFFGYIFVFFAGSCRRHIFQVNVVLYGKGHSPQRKGIIRCVFKSLYIGHHKFHCRRYNPYIFINIFFGPFYYLLSQLQGCKRAVFIAFLYPGHIKSFREIFHSITPSFYNNLLSGHVFAYFYEEMYPPYTPL